MGNANDIYFEHKVIGNDVMNEITIIARFQGARNMKNILEKYFKAGRYVML